MEIKKEICLALSEVLKGLKIADFKIILTSDNLHGDYSTNIPLVIFPKVKEKFKNPVDLASFIINKLQKKLPEIETIEVSPPGFINFFLSKNYLLNKLDQIVSEENYGKGQSLRTPAFAKASAGKQKIMLEFADPNPFKEFHIGHLRNITLGESYARLLEFQEANVWRVNYQGDVGMHVAKALYGIQNSEFRVQSLEKKSVGEKAKFLGEAYAMGARAYEEDEKAKKEIQQINLKIYKKEDLGLKKLWEEGRAWSLEHFENIYQRVGTQYERFYFESEAAEPGRKLVLENIDNGIFKKHEGAIVFRGDHTRVFVTKEDYATYEAKDLALAKIKYSEFPYDKSIIITANEQEPYFKIVLEAMGRVLPKLAEKTVHYSFGFVKLKDGKMSSRSGDVISAEWLLDQAKNKIKEKFGDLSEETLEKVAVGAVKYSMLKFSRTSDITFSFEESINLEGNSGPYLQYTFARTQSVLAKVKSEKFKVKSSRQNSKFEDEELIVLRTLVHFPEIVEEAGENFAPNTLCNYLFDLAQNFNNFYQKHKIIGSKNEDLRLSLTLAVGQVLKTGLYLLGIESPEKM